MAAVSALVLIGAPGSGKSSVLEALSTHLEISGVEHGVIESEELSRGFPPLPDGSWIAQLAGALKLQREAGRRVFLIAATTESDDALRGVLAAAAAEHRLVVCLSAPAGLLATRLDRREPERWPGKPGLIAHARELASVIPRLEPIDMVIETAEREAAEVALLLLGEMRGRGLLAQSAG